MNKKASDAAFAALMIGLALLSGFLASKAVVLLQLRGLRSRPSLPLIDLSETLHLIKSLCLETRSLYRGGSLKNLNNTSVFPRIEIILSSFSTKTGMASFSHPNNLQTSSLATMAYSVKSKPNKSH